MPPSYPKWVRRYDLPSIGSGGEWAIIILTGDGCFTTISDRGDFGHRWNNWGDGDFRSFLMGLCEYYFVEKMAQPKSFDLQKTLANVRQVAKDEQLQEELSEDLDFTGIADEGDFYEWANDCDYFDAKELVRTCANSDVTAFYRYTFSRLCAILKLELQEKSTKE